MAAVAELTGKIDSSIKKPFGVVKKGFTRFADGDVLFAKITPSMENGKVAVARDLEGGLGCGTTEFHVVRPEAGVEPDYLRYYFVRSAYRQEARRNMQGAVGQQRVPPDFIRDSIIPIAPAAEQKRIVSKIDELFSRIDEGERALERVQKLVERYHQSVLKAAVTGELTRDWREKNKDKPESGEALLARILKARREAWERAELEKMKAKGISPANDKWKQKYEEPSPPDTTDLPELPDGWTWASIDQVGLVSGGLTKNQKRGEHELRRPYLRVANVYANRLELDDVHEIGVRESELDRVLLKKADVLVVEGNGSIEQIGRVALWDGSIEGCVHQNHLIKVRCTEVLSSWYVLIWCMSPLGREQIRRVASSSAGLHTLSISKVQALPIPVPTDGELAHIADRFDQMNSLVASQREALRGEAIKSDSLRQTILRAAFSGALVRQDPADEPATTLLASIAADRCKVNVAPARGRRES
jgi:type I restriction enzyme S subunit